MLYMRHVVASVVADARTREEGGNVMVNKIARIPLGAFINRRYVCVE